MQPVTPTHLGRYTYAAMTFDGGYTGIQNDGNSVTHVVGPTAVFSLGGTGVQINSTTSATCEGGFDTGAGASCRIPLPGPIVDGTKYVYRVTRGSDGWITGKVTLPSGTTLTIGKLMPGPGAAHHPVRCLELPGVLRPLGRRRRRCRSAASSSASRRSPASGAVGIPAAGHLRLGGEQRERAAGPHPGRNGC